MNLAGKVHLAFGLAVLVLGIGAYCLRKGTSLHRKLGVVFVICLCVMHAAAFLTYRAFGSFGLFHALSVSNLATLVLAVVPLLRRRPKDRWLNRHYTWMGWTYAGALAAGAAEIVRLPAIRTSGPFTWWGVWFVSSFGVGTTALISDLLATRSRFKARCERIQDWPRLPKSAIHGPSSA